MCVGRGEAVIMATILENTTHMYNCDLMMHAIDIFYFLHNESCDYACMHSLDLYSCLSTFDGLLELYIT